MVVIHSRTTLEPRGVLKVCGADFELSNGLHTEGHYASRPEEAARRLLAQISGFPEGNGFGGTAIEWGRRFLAEDGGSAYLDSSHCEWNLGEFSHAFQAPQILHAALRRVRRAQVDASRSLPADTRLSVLANCSDGRTAWGFHVNVLTTQTCFENILYRKPHYAGFVASHLVTSYIYTSSGLVGPANNRSYCPYQLSQRADWFTEFRSNDTMVRRGLLNERAEPHAAGNLARFHIITADVPLSPVAAVLRFGATSLVIAMCEQGFVDPNLSLDDPLAAASEISRDLSLQQQLPTVVRGQRRSAIEHEMALCELAGEFVASGAAQGIVPQAEAILALWQETLEILASRDLEAISRRCDWALKYLLLSRHRSRKGLNWQSADMKMLDLLYHSLDPQDSLFLKMAAGGHPERMPSEKEIELCGAQPPETTRAFMRAHVLRRYGHAVSSMNWDHICFRMPDYWKTATLLMPDPRMFSRGESEPILRECTSLDELVEAAAGHVADWQREHPTSELQPGIDIVR